MVFPASAPNALPVRFVLRSNFAEEWNICDHVKKREEQQKYRDQDAGASRRLIEWNMRKLPVIQDQNQKEEPEKQQSCPEPDAVFVKITESWQDKRR